MFNLPYKNFWHFVKSEFKLDPQRLHKPFYIWYLQWEEDLVEALKNLIVGLPNEKQL